MTGGKYFLKLSDIIPLDWLQEIQDCFAAATGFAAITVDFQGKPLLRYSNFSKFCVTLRKDEFFYNYCCQSDAHSGLEAVRKGSLCIHRCHAGLIDFAVPIIVDGEYVASVMCGQVKADDDTGLKTRLLEQSEDIFTKHPELRALHDEIPVLPVRRIKETTNLLHTIVNFIVGQFYMERRNAKLQGERKIQEETARQRDEFEMALINFRANPHFLFNALNTAGRQAHMEGANKTEDIIYALADMYRHISRNTSPTVTVEAEAQNVINYMTIQKARFGDMVSFEIDISPEVTGCLVPAMSLQTLVENSMRHGLEKKSEPGRVTVRSFIEEGMACFEVTDDGEGMTDERLGILNDLNKLEASMPNFSGTGIYNLYKKLRYLWNDGFSLQFHENQGGGVRARLDLMPRVSPPKAEGQAGA